MSRSQDVDILVNLIKENFVESEQTWTKKLNLRKEIIFINKFFFLKKKTFQNYPKNIKLNFNILFITSFLNSKIWTKSLCQMISP